MMKEQFLIQRHLELLPRVDVPFKWLKGIQKISIIFPLCPYLYTAHYQCKESHGILRKETSPCLKRTQNNNWMTITDIKGTSPSTNMHRILLKDLAKLTREVHYRLNSLMTEVVKKEVLKLLDVGVNLKGFGSKRIFRENGLVLILSPAKIASSVVVVAWKFFPNSSKTFSIPLCNFTFNFRSSSYVSVLTLVGYIIWGLEITSRTIRCAGPYDSSNYNLSFNSEVSFKLLPPA